MVPDQFIGHLQEAREVVCVEGNATGQLARLIRRETGFEIKRKILRYDGLPMTPESEGNVDVLSIPGPLAWHTGSPVWDGGGVQAVHPLLAYAELVDQQSDRALTAAAELRERFGWVHR